MSKEKVMADARDLIMEKMNSEGRVLTWLAKETEIPYDTIYSCIKKKLFSLSDSNLAKINQVLGTTFEQG